ncbi:hypothetical protein HD806DRAFT_327106 [Xylariaceae sp. AK1471]|nr:hypothetical protein HD806DRAFT_327106 [Xylariaceae sp. AK1471]
MDGLPAQQQLTGHLSDFSDDEAPQPQLQLEHQPSRHGTAFSTVGSSDMPQFAGIDRNEYSDEDIKIVYEIVVRAEAILAEDLTPSSRIPTHALFLAYDEILAEYDLDPSERHISKLVFMVGGVKGQKSMMDKFKSVMARMNITLAIDDPQGSGSEHEYPVVNYANDPDISGGHHAGGDTEDLRANDEDGYTSNTRTGDDESDGYKSSSDYIPDVSTESLNIAQERYLADKAEAFRKRHHVQFSAVATLRRWHNTAHYIGDLCTQADAAREAELRDRVGDIFDTWRALVAKAAQAPPNNVPAGAYSKRTERIAIRAHEIFSTKKALVKWRQSAQDEHRANRDAKRLADRLAKQEQEDEEFKENPQLARLAQRAHRNLVLSRAFTTWSNRVEEEAAKAEAAAKAYEMSLKAKALGLSRKGSALDAMRKLLASKASGSNGASAGAGINPDARQYMSSDPATTKPTCDAPIAPPLNPPPERPLSTIAIATRLQARSPANLEPASSTVRPSTVIPVVTKQSPTSPISVAAAGASATAPSVGPPLVDKCAEDADASGDDELDERTMLARRHILRMRYFGAWEKYTSENIAKVEQFGGEKQNQQVTRSVSTWRAEATSRQQQAVECKIEFEEVRSYQRVAEAVPKWRERASRKAHHGEKILEHYAERAEYYQKITKALPVLRGKTEQAEQREKLLGYYAERTNYYLRTTQALSTWRERAQDASERHHLRELYGGRANYYYTTRNTLLAWQPRAKQRRKERLREAHLETRRVVKKGMGERCIKRWRDKLEPSYERYEIMNVTLVDAIEDREWRQTSQAFTIWRRRAQEKTEAAATGDAMLKQKAMGQWREKTALRIDVQAESEEHWEIKAKSRALKNWNLSSLQNANRPEMVANALEKKERRLVRQSFETWYGRTADKLVPVELPDGTYRNVGQVVEGARQQATEHQARGLLHTWRAATNSRAAEVEEEAYAPTPGRPRLLLGSLGRRETTTPLAPVPSRARWQTRDSTMGRSDIGARASRSERPKNLRVSWAT